MADIYQEYYKRGHKAAEEGDWDSAIKYGKMIPSNWNFFETLPSLVPMPDEAVGKVLDALKNRPNERTQFLFEYGSNIPDHASPQILERVANLATEDHYTTANVHAHPNWKPSEETQNRQKVADFWSSYERRVTPEHFAAVKSHYSGKPEEIKHRDISGKSHENAYILGGNMFNATPEGKLVKPPHPDSNQGVVTDTSTDKATPLHEIIPHLGVHAKAVQNEIMRDEFIPKKYIRGKPYIQVHRGIAGNYAKAIRQKVGYNQKTNTIKEGSHVLPSAPFSSWSTDPQIAGRFAHREIEGHPNQQGVVISKWMPLEDVLHSGHHTVITGQEHPHTHESEIIFGHPEGKLKIKSSDLSFQGPTHEYGDVGKPTIEPAPKPSKT